MGPSHRSEREGHIGAVENRRVETIGAADCESELGRTPVPPRGDPLGQYAARPLDAALVEGDEWDANRQCAKDQFALAGFQLHRRKRALLVDLDYCRGRHDSRGVERLEFLERAAAQPADDEKAETDRGVPATGEWLRCRASPSP